MSQSARRNVSAPAREGSRRISRTSLVERFGRGVVRLPGLGVLRKSGVLRGVFDRALELTNRRGVEWRINAQDTFRFSPRIRMLQPNHEVKAWQRLMDRVREGDVCVDLGANVGLYALSLAKRVGSTGQVHAFEPDPAIFRLLKTHVRLNDFTSRITLHGAAVGASRGQVKFRAGEGAYSRVAGPEEAGISVPVVTLDEVFADSRVDLLKIDVEGYEGLALEGARGLIASPERQPRLIYLELHNWAWDILKLSTTVEGIRTQLETAGYRIENEDGKPVGPHDANWFAVSTVRT